MQLRASFAKATNFFILTVHKPLHLESKENDNNKQAAPTDQNTPVEKANAHSPQQANVEQKIESQKPQTENMEVQKHPHHVMHKKKWNEYLLEFFMLFLAVFLGFVAENIRENSVERNREKEYMKSLLTDLRNDTSELNHKLKLFSSFPVALNQLARDCNAAELPDTIQQRMYAANMKYLGTMQIYFTDKTATQLKNSGNMRLIGNHEVSDSITLYWQGIEDVKSSNANYENYRRALRQLSFKIFNYIFYKPYDNTFNNEVGFRVMNPQLTLKDPLLLKEYGSEISLVADNIEIYYLPALNKQRKMAENLIRLLQKEYHLENE